MVGAVRMDWRVHPGMGFFGRDALMVFSQVTYAAEIRLRFTAPDDDWLRYDHHSSTRTPRRRVRPVNRSGLCLASLG